MTYSVAAIDLWRKLISMMYFQEGETASFRLIYSSIQRILFHTYIVHYTSHKPICYTYWTTEIRTNVFGRPVLAGIIFVVVVLLLLSYAVRVRLGKIHCFSGSRVSVYFFLFFYLFC